MHIRKRSIHPLGLALCRRFGQTGTFGAIAPEQTTTRYELEIDVIDLRKFTRLLAASLVAVCFSTAAVIAQGEVRSIHGDWQVRCDKPPGSKVVQCALIQNVTAEDRDNVGLSVIVLKTADLKARILRVLAPLGVLLPSGLGLRVDDADIGRAGFVRCLPNGCIAEVILQDDLINKLKTGKFATFIIFQTPEEGIGIPISLSGFAEGYDALPDKAKPDAKAN